MITLCNLTVGYRLQLRFTLVFLCSPVHIFYQVPLWLTFPCIAVISGLVTGSH